MHAMFMFMPECRKRALCQYHACVMFSMHIWVGNDSCTTHRTESQIASDHLTKNVLSQGTSRSEKFPHDPRGVLRQARWNCHAADYLGKTSICAELLSGKTLAQEWHASSSHCRHSCGTAIGPAPRTSTGVSWGKAGLTAVFRWVHLTKAHKYYEAYT